MAIDAPALRKIELRREGRHAGFAIAQETGTQEARYPHVYGMGENLRMTLRLQGEAGAEVEVLCDGKSAGRLRLTEALPELTEVELPLVHDGGEHELTLRLTGRLVIDWFRLRP